LPLTAQIIVIPQSSGLASSCAKIDTGKFTITVLPKPMLNIALTNDTLCHGDTTTPIAFSGTFTDYEWESSKSLGGIPTSPQIGNFGKYEILNNNATPDTAIVIISYKYVFDLKECLGKDTGFSIIVLPNPTVSNLLPDDTLCSGDTTQPVGFTGNANVYQWISNNSFNNIPTSLQTGNFGRYPVVNNTAMLGTAKIMITPQSVYNGKICNGLDTSFLINVLPRPTLNTALPNNILCNGDTTTPIAFSGAFTDYEWESDNSLGGNVPLGIQTGNFGRYVVANNNTTPDTANIRFSYKYLFGVKECLGRDTSFSITVLPNPVIDNLLTNDTLCSGVKTQAIVFTGAASYRWVVSGDPIDSLPNTPQIGNFGEYVLLNKSNRQLTSFITVTPLYTYMTKTCIGQNAMFSITVNPIPELENIPSDYTLCSGEKTKDISFGADVVFTCTVNGGGTINGLPIGATTGDFGEYILENKTANPLIATVTITPDVVGGNGNCLVKDTSFQITVNPEPTLTNILQDDSLCSDDKTTPIVFEGVRTSFSWTSIGTVTSVPTSGTGNFGEYTVINKSTSTLKSIITVKPKYLSNSNGEECEGSEQKFEVVVSPLTTISAITPNVTYLCEGEELKIEISATGGSLSYQWYHDDELLAGEQGSEYVVSSASMTHSGVYYAEVYGSCSDAKSRAITINVRGMNMLVEKWHDVIFVDNSTKEYNGYQWYKNGRIIQGATEQFYQEIGGLNGCYSVELRLKAGGRIRSCDRCAYKTPKETSLSIYPNPSRQGSSIIVDFTPPKETVSIETVEIITPNGQRIATQSVNGKLFEIETANLPAGMYILKITTTDKQIFNEKIVVY